MAKTKQKEGQKVDQIMSTDLVMVESDTPIREAAQKMRDFDVGDVLVTEDGTLRGIVTDRDIVVRCVAEDIDTTATEVGQLCSAKLVTLSPWDRTDDAVKLMKQRAVRRIPVVDGLRPVGIVSLGDLAIARDAGSALGRISSATPNH